MIDKLEGGTKKSLWVIFRTGKKRKRERENDKSLGLVVWLLLRENN